METIPEKKQPMYLYHHLFLPRKLPGEDDYSPECDKMLLGVTVRALQKFKESAADSNAEGIDLVLGMIRALDTLLDSRGALDEEQLRQALTTLCEHGKSCHPCY